MRQHAAIKLILETDAIIQPLTGIGRYAFELLRAFAATDDFADIRCFSRGRWQKPHTVISSNQHTQGSASAILHNGSAGRWRTNPAKAALRRVLPYISQRSLGKYSGSHLYHSPNYRLSPFAGKKIATFHDLSLFRYPQYHPQDRRRILTPGIEQAATEADHLITDTEQVRSEVIAYFGLPAEKVTAVHLASSLGPATVSITARDEFLQKLGLQPGRYFLNVSTLEPRKNISGLLGAFESLPTSTRKHFPLVLAGQLGWGSESIMQPLSRGKARGDVIQPGYLSNDELCYLYSGARVFVYPSIYEGFGLPIIEAQGFGIPVITSDCSCMPEVAGEAGLFINPEAYASLAAAMQKMVDDQELHAKLSRLSLVNAARYSWQKTARQTLDVYRSVLASPR